MNTNRTDLRNMINRIQDHLSEEFDSDGLWSHNALHFGKKGAGNFFPNGKAYASDDLESIVGRIRQVMEDADAFLYITTLGGGTGSGSVRYVVNHIKRGHQSDHYKRWMDGIIQATLGVWPDYYENTQRHFNAVCGLSRLLTISSGGKEREQNADIVLLAANSHLAEIIASKDEESDDGVDELVMDAHLRRRRNNLDDMEEINIAIVSAIDMMIGPSRETEGVIDVADFVENPSLTGSYHFTPGVATGMNSDVYELRYMIDQAANNAYVPLDISTVDSIYTAVYAPEDMVEKNDISPRDVMSAVGDWQNQYGLSLHGQSSLVPKQETGSDIDVMVLLGGFDLSPLLEKSWDEFESFADQLNLGENQSPGEGTLTRAQLNSITDHLQDYADRHEE
jgi:hypothetical protein